MNQARSTVISVELRALSFAVLKVLLKSIDRRKDSQKSGSRKCFHLEPIFQEIHPDNGYWIRWWMSATGGTRDSLSKGSYIPTLVRMHSSNVKPRQSLSEDGYCEVAWLFQPDDHIKAWSMRFWVLRKKTDLRDELELTRKAPSVEGEGGHRKRMQPVASSSRTLSSRRNLDPFAPSHITPSQGNPFPTRSANERVANSTTSQSTGERKHTSPWCRERTISPPIHQGDTRSKYSSVVLQLCPAPWTKEYNKGKTRIQGWSLNSESPITEGDLRKMSEVPSVTNHLKNYFITLSPEIRQDEEMQLAKEGFGFWPEKCWLAKLPTIITDEVPLPLQEGRHWPWSREKSNGIRLQCK